MKHVILLGASGSIGVQTIDVIEQHPDEFELVAFSVGKRVQIVRDVLAKMDVKEVCVMNKEDADALILDMKDYLFNVCSKYSNIKLIDGYTLIPHIEYYFLDLLHPNGLGMEVYGTNLAEKIKVLNW